jgi:hypothetical protein
MFLIHVDSQYRAVFILQRTAIWTGRGVDSPINNAGEEHPDLLDRSRLLPEVIEPHLRNHHPR